MEEISIPENITSVGENAFLNCDALKTINYAGTKEDWEQINHSMLPKGVNLICEKNVNTVITSGSCGENLRWTLSGTESSMILTISGTGEMNNSSFYENDSIEKVIIEDGCTSIGNQAFSGCSNLTSVTIPDGVTSMTFFN